MATASSPSRSRAASESKGVRVWGEVGVTICVNTETREFIRPLVGHERWAKDDSLAALKATMREVNEFNSEILEELVEELTRTVNKAREQAEEDEDTPRSRARRRARKRR